MYLSSLFIYIFIYLAVVPRSRHGIIANTKYLKNVRKISVLQITFPDFFNPVRKTMISLSPEYELSNVNLEMLVFEPTCLD